MECLDMAPSSDILFGYKEGKLSEERYKELYLKQLAESKEELSKFMNLVVKESKSRDVIILCYEKGSKFCHRHILRKVINRKFVRKNLPEIEEL